MLNINIVRQLINRMPVRTHYEFVHFELGEQGQQHRQLRYALRQLEELHDQTQILHAKVDLINHKLTKYEDHLELGIRQRIAFSKIKQLERQIKDLESMQAQINDWLSALSNEEIENSIGTVDLAEDTHWCETLGRELGIELLVDGKSSKDTMSRLALLPLTDYKNSVVIATKFAEFLKTATQDAETNTTEDNGNT